MSGLMSLRSSHSSQTYKLLPFLAFFIFCIFVFKVDIFIYQTASAARRNVYDTRPSLVIENSFHRDFIESWGTRGARVLEEGDLLELTLDQQSGSGFESKKVLLFGRIDMQIKLVPGNSAGTITTNYLASEGEEQRDKIEFQFLGNTSGDPYTVHTNIYTKGKADREQQFFLWFDPSQDFHTYSILWNPKCILFYVDGVPIREFKNLEHLGVPFPKDQPMRFYSGLWSADDWATQGGRVKIDWTAAPFTTSYRNFSVDGCIWSFRSRSSSCTADDFLRKPVLKMELDERSRERMKRVQKEYMVYDYCSDHSRFHDGLAPECSIK